MSNRLARESSPYLKQHEHNPVDWYPWGPEALEKARREDKPIFLSVGYSACHWCHVMAHESFENEAVAAILNREFVSIKVDREERPDLDHIYQNVAQAMTGGGGWPLSVFLRPDLAPFYGGTYFPPEPRYGRPGFPQVLEALARAYRESPGDVDENARKLVGMIGELEKIEAAEPDAETAPESGEARARALTEAAERILSMVDWTNGGVGGAPKFPNSMLLKFLWRFSLSSPAARDELARASQGAVVLSLTRMAEGGIFDQIGGGFSRYSVDERWAVPHFEKMTYDNALLLALYSEVLLSGRDLIRPEARALFLRTVRSTVAYVLREMVSPEGFFYAAQDADSEGEEGKFFVWDEKELAEVLSGDELRAFCLRYGVDAAGNFEHGKTVLYQMLSEGEVAERLGIDDAGGPLRAAEAKVFAAREKRVRPGLDDKALVAWNGLMIGGLSWAARALREDEESRRLAELALEAARNCARALEARCWDGERLSATFQGGGPRGNGFLDDYAFLAGGLAELARHGGSEAAGLLGFSDRLVERALDEFRDDTGSPGYCFTGRSHEKLIHRPKTIQDQAIPSGTSVLLGLLQFGAERLEGERAFAWEKEWRDQLGRLARLPARHPYGFGELLCSLLLSTQGAGVLEGAAARLDERIWDPSVGLKRVAPEWGERLLLCRNRTCTEI